MVNQLHTTKIAHLAGPWTLKSCGIGYLTKFTYRAVTSTNQFIMAMVHFQTRLTTYPWDLWDVTHSCIQI